jgi:hypothetical protein
LNPLLQPDKVPQLEEMLEMFLADPEIYRVNGEYADFVLRTSQADPIARARFTMWAYYQKQTSPRPWSARELAAMSNLERDLADWLVDVAENQPRGEFVMGRQARGAVGPGDEERLRDLEAALKQRFDDLPDDSLSSLYKKKPAKEKEGGGGRGGSKKKRRKAAEKEAVPEQKEKDPLKEKLIFRVTGDSDTEPELAATFRATAVLEVGTSEASNRKADGGLKAGFTCFDPLQVLVLQMTVPFGWREERFLQTVLEVAYSGRGAPSLEWAKAQAHRTLRWCLIVVCRAGKEGFWWERKANSHILVRRWGALILQKDYASVQGAEAGESLSGDSHILRRTSR